MVPPLDATQFKSLREQVESLLPTWQSWYPSLFHAAEDLGLIRARVCDPALLSLSNRHAAVRNEAVQAFREQWSVEDEPVAAIAPGKSKKSSKKSGQKAQPGYDLQKNAFLTEDETGDDW